MKKAIIILVLVAIVGVAVFSFVQSKKNETVLVCVQNANQCKEFKKLEVTTLKDIPGCVVADGLQLCGTGVFPSKQVLGEARNGCAQIHGVLENPRPGFYECTNSRGTYSWWPFATTWEKK